MGDANTGSQIQRLRSIFSSEARNSSASNLDEAQIALTLVREFEQHGMGWFWQTDRNGHLTYLSDKVAVEVVLDGQPARGALLAGLFRSEEDDQDTRTLGFHLSSRTSFSNMTVRTSLRDDDRWWSISGRPMFDSFAQFRGFSGSGSDLTKRHEADAEITKLALFDGLTGLANRQRMKGALDQALGLAGTTYQVSSLLLLDLDRFKAVNDTLGHPAGDALLQQVAQRLRRCVSRTDLVGRLGGDEFQILIPGECSRERLDEIAQAVISSVSQPYSIAGSSISIGCSIGVAIAPHDGADSTSLVRSADLALYAAKDGGRGTHRFYEPHMLAQAQSRKVLEEDLRTGLLRNQLRVVYQPVVSTADARITGYEALVRWDHPTRGPISPAEFIPIAEDCGLIEQLGEWVLRTATLAASTWPVNIRLAVNVSPIQFANPALPGIVTSALATAGIDPDRLELEITEGVFLNNSTAAAAMFKLLKTIGVRFALDDFGTGYSSLAYLQTTAFDKIKIDQSFVRGAAIVGNRNAAIIQAIVTLADTLGMETTAEGVELHDEVDLIRRLGCSHIQGYIYSKPIRPEEVLTQLSEGGNSIVAAGHRISRVPRIKMLRKARFECDERMATVRIRNLSASGAMIDGLNLSASHQGLSASIELVGDRMVAATIRWLEEGQVGLEFLEDINLAELNQSSGVSSLRRLMPA